MPGGFLQASIPAEALTTHKVGSHEAPQAGHQSEAHGGYPGLRHSDCNCCSGKICKRTQGGVRAVLKNLGGQPFSTSGVLSPRINQPTYSCGCGRRTESPPTFMPLPRGATRAPPTAFLLLLQASVLSPHPRSGVSWCNLYSLPLC